MLPPATKTIVLTDGEPEAKREEIRRYFHDTFDVYEKLFEVLRRPEAYYLRADPLRHPLIFYLGHTAVFFVNKLVLAKLLHARINPAFESIFAIGVDEMSWDDLDESHYDWPSVEDVMAYRDRVRQVVDERIREMPLTLPIGWDSPFWPVLMGIEHERIHLETSSVLIRQLPIEEVRAHEAWPVCPDHGEPPANEMVDVPGGDVVLGKSRDHRLYGWDNEYGRHEARIEPFGASRYLTTNREFLAFVEDGGYGAKEHWTDEGWSWVEYRKPEHPLFWIRDGEGWRFRTMAQVVDMPWDWPVEVNHLEARAFCSWLAARTGRPIRLPTEEEWVRLRNTQEVPDQPDWDQAPGNINLEDYASSTPVTRHRIGPFHDLIGNVWQWTETPIFGFPGFDVHPLYDDFSTPTFDEKHNLIKGGSWISTGNEATLDARYAFRRHFFQHAGFRYIETEEPVSVRSEVYETDEAVAQYCDFHFGPEHFGVPNFPAQLAELCLALTEGSPQRRALDLGCAVGRATFELAREFDHVTGLDFSARFIRIGDQLVEKGRIQYVLQDEGELVSYHTADLAELGLDEMRGRVEFFQADASNLKPLYAGYDLVLAANLIDRLYSPRRFLTSIHERIEPGGFLVLTSPYTWLEEHTERSEWIGGFKRDGENLTTLDALHEILGDRFEPVGAPRDVEFVIRETARKHQHTVAQWTAWRRR
jgi:5-histidylcysteine sulfoxide synthase/putative 4-mercaptohistidine N1-methyltranferase